MLAYDEGVRDFLYHDGTGRKALLFGGHITGGIGHNFDAKGIPAPVIELLFSIDLDEALHAIEEIFLGFYEFSEVRQLALVNMMFQLGPVGFAHFKDMIASINAGNWEKAANDARESRWYFQCAFRAKRVISMLRDNEIPKEYL